MKKTIGIVIAVYKILTDAHISALDMDDKLCVIKAAHELKKYVSDYEDFVRESTARLMTDNIQKTLHKIQHNEPVSDDERALFNNYQKEISACLDGYLRGEVEIQSTLNDEIVHAIIATNDFTVGQIMLISDLF